MPPRSWRSVVRALIPWLGLVALLSGFEWGGRTARLARELEAADPTRRREIVRLLSEHDPARARVPLLDALDDPDLEVRGEAALAVGRLGLREALPTLVDWLDDPDPGLRAAAARGLGALGDERGLAGLVRALGDVSADVRVAAVEALEGLGRSAALVPLLGRLDDPDVGVRLAAIEALATLGLREAVVPLVGRARDDVAEVRIAVATTLGALGDPRALPALRRALRDPSEDVQLAAAGALGQMGDPAAIEALIALLRGDAPRLAEAAVAALGRMEDRRAVDGLLEALARPRLRGAVIAALRERLRRLRRRPGGADQLLARLADRLARVEDPERGTALAELLADVATPADRAVVEPAVLRALREDAASETAALGALAAVGSPEAVVPLLRRLAGVEDEAAFDEVLRALERYADRGAVDSRMVDPLLDLLPRVPAGARPRVVALLGRTGAARATPALLPLLDHRDGALRLATVRAVGSLGGPGSGEALVGLLDDPDPAVRLAAASALQPTGGAGEVARLLDMLRRPAPTDRHAVILALGGIAAAGGLDAPATGDAGAGGRPTGADLAGALTEAAAHPDRTLAARAVDALGRWGAAPATAALRGRAADPAGSYARRREAMAALAAARDPAAAPIARAALREAPVSIRTTAALLLGEVGEVGADLPLLLAAMDDAPWPTSVTAAFAVARLARRGGALPASAVQALCARMGRGGSSRIRANVAIALAAAGVARCPSDPGATPAALLDARRSPGERAALARWVAAANGAGAQTPPPDGDTPPADEGPDVEELLEACAREARDASVRAACTAPTLPGLAGEVDVHAISADGSRVLADELVALRLADDTVALVHTDANGHVRLRGAPDGPIRLEDPFDVGP